MFRTIFISVILTVFLISCGEECQDALPEPLSCNLQYVNVKGEDLYKNGTFHKDSLTAFYKGVRINESVNLEVKINADSTAYFIDVMPLLRKAYTLRLDTVFISPFSADIDTLNVKIINVENECYSSIYQFERLEYNGVKLSVDEQLYKIEK